MARDTPASLPPLPGQRSVCELTGILGPDARFMPGLRVRGYISGLGPTFGHALERAFRGGLRLEALGAEHGQGLAVWLLRDDRALVGRVVLRHVILGGEGWRCEAGDQQSGNHIFLHHGSPGGLTLVGAIQPFQSGAVLTLLRARVSRLRPVRRISLVQRLRAALRGLAATSLSGLKVAERR